MSENTIGSILKAIRVLNAFTEEDFDLSLAELNRKTGIPKPTLLRICNSLLQEQLLEKDPETRKYRLGIRVLELANIYRSRRGVVSYINDLLRQCADKIGETVSVYKLQGDQRHCLFRVEGYQAVRHHISIGVALPLHLGAAGKVILANLTPKEQEEYLKRYSVPKFFKTKEAFLAHLKEIREKQFSLSKGERDSSLAAAAVPLFYRTGKIFGALSVSGPKERFLKNFGEDESELLKRYGKDLNYIIDEL